MSNGSRLGLALATGDLTLPDAGRIAVFDPMPDVDLSALPQNRCHVLSAFSPTHAALSAQGFECGLEPDGRYGAAIVFAARAKAQTLSVIARACGVTDGPVVIDGAKTDGIESVLKACRARTDVSAALSKAHGKLFWFQAGADFDDWAIAGSHNIGDGFVTAPGVFSADAIDPASRLLADHLPQKLGARLVDLGAGWGYLSARVLVRSTVQQIDLVEANHAALTCAQRNVADARAKFHWSDVTGWTPPEPADCVIMNPPFHTGRSNEPDLGRAFIQAAARCLKPRGQLWMVANRHLPYETELTAQFRDIKETGGDNRFKILCAVNPARKAR